MAELGMMSASSPATDFVSMYTSKTCSPIFSLSGALSQLKFSPSPTKSTPDFYPDLNNIHEMRHLMGGSDVFCTAETVSSCVAHLNQELSSLGMSSLYDAKTRKFEVFRLVNATHELLQKQRRSMRVREELENRQHRTEADIAHLHVAQDRLKEQLERNERELVQLQEKERQLLNKNRQLTGKLKTERDEAKRLLSIIEHRDTQYKHEVKKKEREHNKLKERMHTLLASKVDRKIAMDLATPIPRSDGKRGKWMTPGVAQEEELYRQVIGSYEARTKDLMLENSEMRQCLSLMQKEVVALLHAPDGDVDKDSLNSSTGCKRQDSLEGVVSDDEANGGPPHTDLSDAHFQLPYELVRGGIQRSLQDKCKRLKHYIRKMERQKVIGVAVRLPATANSKDPSPRRLSSDESAANKKELEKLRKQLKRYSDIIEQQELLLQQNLQPDEDQTGDSAFMQDSQLWEEKETLQRERELFQEQKTNFEKERKTFTDAAIRLGREKKLYEEDKAKFLQQQFMHMTPFRDARPKSAGSVSHCRSKRRLPLTPSQAWHHAANTTSTPHDPVRPHPGMPTTADLYRTVGLLPLQEEEGLQHPTSCHGRPAFPNPKEIMNGGISGSPCLPHAQRHSGAAAAGGAMGQSSPASNSARLNQHIDNIKQTLFQQHSAELADDDTLSGEEEEEEEEETGSEAEP